ncbi:MAG: hypothetical protein JXB35_16310 [Anaerolineae bacterium]|nr:hypothetical protein [Anaerolineae bacterium]
MPDDLRDAFGDDVFLETEDEAIEEETGERQNRTFLIALAVLGGLLFCAIAAFIVWAAVINPRQQAQLTSSNEAILATNEAIEIAMAMTATAESQPVPEPETEEPTEPPEPTATATPVVRPTNTPEPEATEATEGEAVGESEQGEAGEATTEAGEEAPGEATATPRPRRTPTPRPEQTSSNQTSSESEATPDTGLGDVLLVIVALLLLGLIVFARRLRKA